MGLSKIKKRLHCTLGAGRLARNSGQSARPRRAVTTVFVKAWAATQAEALFLVVLRGRAMFTTGQLVHEGEHDTGDDEGHMQPHLPSQL